MRRSSSSRTPRPLTHLPTDNEVYQNRFLEDWGQLTTLRKPIIAAVSGYAVRPPPAYILFPPLRALTGTPRSSAAGASSR